MRGEFEENPGSCMSDYKFPTKGFNFMTEAKQISMEKPIRCCEKEYMRMAMLKHEETFKEQVYELHRLYQVQKLLMKNMEASSRGIKVNQGGWNFKNAIGSTQNGHHNGAQRNHKIKFDLEGHAMEDATESESDRVLEIINEAEIELTLGPSSYHCKKVETRQLTSDSGHSLSSSTREEISGGIIGLVQVPHSKSGCQSGIRNSYDIEEQSRSDRSKQPPWLSQILSLNTA